jgi:hypothetical protein
MAATKKAAPKAKSAKKAPRKPKTSSAPGEGAKAHEWLVQEALPQVEVADGDIKPEPERIVIKDPKTGQFLPGNKSGGRKKGSRSKLATEFFDDFYAHWLEGDEETGIPKGRAAIQWVYKNRPDLYFNGAIKILPQQVDVRVSEFSELTDDALDTEIRRLQQQLGAALAMLNPERVMQ